MRIAVWIFTGLIFLSSCKKTEVITPVVHPEMKYTNLFDAEVQPGKIKSVDLDGDGTTDFHFETLLVGDPTLQQDKLQFYATSRIEDYLLNNNQEQTPKLNQQDHIGFDHAGYEWNHISALILAEKITGMTGPSFWRGNWTDARHNFLPVRMKRNSQDFLGWIELSMDTRQGKLILHRGAICKTSGVPVVAGY